jgi:hypothetical protein
MEKILKALKELGVGRHDMDAVAEKMEGDATPQHVGRIVHRLNGVISDGMRIKIGNGGRKLFISLHNVRSAPTGATEGWLK